MTEATMARRESPASSSADNQAWQDIVGGLLRFQLWGRIGWLDIKRRYRRTVIGPFWSTLTLAVYIFAVGTVGAGLFKHDPSTYLPYLAGGMIVWTMLSTVILESCTMLVAGTALYRNVKFEYSVLAYALAWRNLVIFLHNIFIFFIVAMIFKRDVFSPSLIYVIPGMVLLLLNALWIALLGGVICLRFRDVQPIVQTFIQISMLITPIFWTPENLSGTLRLLFAQLNPIYRLIDIVRAPLLGQVPTAASYLAVMGITVVGWIIAYLTFRHFRKRIPYWS
jgi:ABC-type polysaccharide/polyol phosphate export permease